FDLRQVLLTLVCTALSHCCASSCFPHLLPPFTLAFSFPVPATTGIHTLSLHDALPISPGGPINQQNPGREHHEHRRRDDQGRLLDRKSTRLNSSHVSISYAVFCLKKKKAGVQGR